MPKIDMKSEEYKIKDIYEDYKKFRPASLLNVFVVICILFLILELHLNLYLKNHILILILDH